ncbi:HAD family hydrolase [Candidatus Woesearchaeota archaeon]|nr:HAD family hydrolase [Candidatus Woesearchaeota archaeon]
MTLNKSCFFFDIDGTLIDFRQTWEQTYNSLYQEHHGFTLNAPEMKSMFGPPEAEGHEKILRGRGLYTEEGVQQLVAATETAMLSTLGQTKIEPLPGVINTLNELQRQHATLACYTGNQESIAKDLLKASSLDSYFEVLAWSDAKTTSRHQVLQQAVDKLAARGKVFEPRNCYGIGDSPSDITTAHAFGFTAVAVATGPYKRGELERCNPHYILNNMTQFQKTLFL